MSDREVELEEEIQRLESDYAEQSQDFNGLYQVNIQKDREIEFLKRSIKSLEIDRDTLRLKLERTGGS